MTFVTYIRRLTQSLLTFARLAQGEADTAVRLRALVDRLEMLATCLSGGARPKDFVGSLTTVSTADDLAHVQVRRLELQLTILEKAAAMLI